MAASGGACETLDDIPAHVWRGLPDSMSLSPSAVNPNRIGVWASSQIPKGKRFGPFVGERKKRSQVPSNVYMWEVYFPTRGWMCVDATDPMKGNWLRYVNWARSSQEQNLFPLEINRAIYYKVLRPIATGEELLVWYNGEESAEIAAALEEERSSGSGKKHSPRAKRARKKLLEKAQQACLGRLSEDKPLSTSKLTVAEMCDSEEGVNKEEDPSASSEPAQETTASHSSPTEAKNFSPSQVLAVEREQNEEEEVDQGEIELPQPQKSPEHPAETESADSKEQPNPQLIPDNPVKERSPLRDEFVSSVMSPELDAEGDPDFEDDAQGGNGNHHCQHCVTPPSPTVMSSQNGPPQQGTEALSKETVVEPDQPYVLDENGESKELHPCKYCNKVFGTHTNMRRHQRRIHERHLMPKGVRRKGILLQDMPAQQDEQDTTTALQKASPNASPPPTYVPSMDTEDEGEREEGMMDISKNISENLSLYIDGKILSTNTVSSCEVIEVPKVESHCTVQPWSSPNKDQRDSLSPSGKDWPASISGGNSCNQQPLDLSSTVSKRESCVSKGPAGDEGSTSLGSPDTNSSPGSAIGVSPASPCSTSENPHCESSSPPSLTPVTMNPSSPSSSSLASSTPPPPVLPTVPSPPPLTQSPDSSFPKLSPKPIDHPLEEISQSSNVTETFDDTVNLNIKDLDQTAKETADPMTDALPQSPQDTKQYYKDSFSKSETLLKGSTSDSELHALKNANHAVSPCERSTDSESSQSNSFDGTFPSDLNIKTEGCRKPQSPGAHVYLTPNTESLSPTHKAEVDSKSSEAESLDDDDDNLVTDEYVGKLFGNAAALLEHRSTLHGVGRIYVCSLCSKEFAYLCNLQQHQNDLHPGQSCTHTGNDIKKEENNDVDAQEDPTEELYTTIKIMASEAGKPKGPDVRLGINQHYPSFKPPPFPYHNRTPAGSVASATNFTTHNIPQAFSTAISDKRRYTPKKNPIPLKQVVKQLQNGAVSTTAAAIGGQNAFRRMGQPKRLNFNQDIPSKMKMTALNKKKNQLVQKAISQKNKAAAASAKKASVQVKEEEQPTNVCPYCGREFTYPASLSKHVACSCPQKPVAKKKKGALTPQDKNMSLRSRATDSEIKQEADSGIAGRPLGKSRARNSELLENEVTPTSKGKSGLSQVRIKRPASNTSNTDSMAPKSKKGRKSSTQPPVPSPSLPAITSDSMARPATKAQRGSKDMALKKEVETKAPIHIKKEERFSRRMRERMGGPVTRSLQMANSE
ncbi:hypothetical protein NFI96_033367, partial [Prochilodus magdalenae]